MYPSIFMESQPFLTFCSGVSSGAWSQLGAWDNINLIKKLKVLSGIRCFFKWRDRVKQGIVKVREWIFLIGSLTKVIPLKLFLGIVPSSSADITRVLRGCFREGSVYMYVISFCFVYFVSKQKKTSNAVGMSSLIFWLQAWDRSLGSQYVLIHCET